MMLVYLVELINKKCRLASPGMTIDNNLLARSTKRVNQLVVYIIPFDKCDSSRLRRCENVSGAESHATHPKFLTDHEERTFFNRTLNTRNSSKSHSRP